MMKEEVCRSKASWSMVLKPLAIDHDETKLPGKYIIWCLQLGLYPRVAWRLIMYKTAASRVDIMEQNCNVKIIRWLGLPRMTNTSALYRKKGSLQLPFTAISVIYKAGKVRTVIML